MKSTPPSGPLAPAEHFDSLARQDRAAHLGMWLFLTSEVLLFGALFGLYTGYRLRYAHDFSQAARHNDIAIGTVNTALLITSSLLAAWAVHAIAQDRRRAAWLSLLGTIALGLVFLCLKGLEYREHFQQGIFPGSHYRFAELPGQGANIFFTMYYLMTGLHALHVTAGLVALGVMLVWTLRGRFSAARHTPLELTVLYWHLVDVIWIFVWPLMYLGGPR
jgi:cytochrome c oxidase subunit 3